MPCTWQVRRWKKFWKETTWQSGNISGKYENTCLNFCTLLSQLCCEIELGVSVFFSDNILLRSCRPLVSRSVLLWHQEGLSSRRFKTVREGLSPRLRLGCGKRRRQDCGGMDRGLSEGKRLILSCLTLASSQSNNMYFNLFRLDNWWFIYFLCNSCVIHTFPLLMHLD